MFISYVHDFIIITIIITDGILVWNYILQK